MCVPEISPWRFCQQFFQIVSPTNEWTKLGGTPKFWNLSAGVPVKVGTAAKIVPMFVSHFFSSSDGFRRKHSSRACFGGSEVSSAWKSRTRSGCSPWSSVALSQFTCYCLLLSSSFYLLEECFLEFVSSGLVRVLLGDVDAREDFALYFTYVFVRHTHAALLSLRGSPR